MKKVKILEDFSDYKKGNEVIVGDNRASWWVKYGHAKIIEDVGFWKDLKYKKRIRLNRVIKVIIKVLEEYPDLKSDIRKEVLELTKNDNNTNTM
jgi:hypothetical protein